MRAKPGLLVGVLLAGAMAAALAWGPPLPDLAGPASDAGPPPGRAADERPTPAPQRPATPDAASLLGDLARVGGLPLPRAPLGGPSVLDSPFQFSRRLVDPDVVNGEPILTVESGGKRWVAGTAMPQDAAGHLWSSADGGATFQDEAVPTDGPGDTTIFVGTDGRMYWAALKLSGGPGHELQLASRPLAGGAWIAATFQNYDRPWFVSRSGATFAVATDIAGGHVDLFTADGQGGWSDAVEIPGTAGTFAGFPAALPDGRLFVPLYAGQQRKAAISNAAVNAWEVQTAPGADETAHLPWAATDTAGNAYLAWDNDTQAKYASWSAANGWRGPTTVSTLAGATTWTITIIAGAEGKIDLAWYSRLPNNQFWQVLFRQVTDAHLAYPNLGQAVVELEPWTADPIEDAHGMFLDFLTLTKLSDGNAAVTFNCHLLQDPFGRFPPHPYCPRAASSRVVYGEQTAGPTI